MKAAVCTRIGAIDDIAIAEVPAPVPREGEVAVAVRAASVNFPDVLMVAGAYQVRTEPPFVLGSEFAGEVIALGAGVTTPAVGTRVIGAALTGAFTEIVAVPAASVQPLPDGLDFVAGAAFRVAYATAYHAVVTIGEAERGQTVVVLGAAGGVGLASVDIAHRLGMRVTAAASSAEKLRVCAEYGADELVDYTREPLKERLKELTAGGADVVVDPVGGEQSEAALRATRWGGRFVVVGFASGHIPRIPLNLVLLKGAQIRGFEMRTLPDHAPGAIATCQRVLAELVADGMRPHISAVYSLDDVVKAMSDVAERRVLGKVVITL
ncbi:MAG: NADPH:quinone reductase [Actinomycetota bacterium]|jgi:NADPH2:quinone reductase|nr:NADPH:quinone reductase [Actinomycetota bacterium]